jgi:hypothetical protein
VRDTVFSQVSLTTLATRTLELSLLSGLSREHVRPANSLRTEMQALSNTQGFVLFSSSPSFKDHALG